MAVPWRVTTWNLQGSAAPPVERVAAALRELDPDVVILQEVRRAQCRRLAALLGWHHTWHRKHHPYSPLVWWRTEGMAIVSRHRIIAPVATSLTPKVSTWTYRHRILAMATVQRDDGASLRCVDLHLASDQSGRQERVDQATRARGFLEPLQDATVIAGDLNDHDETDVISILCAATHVDAWTVAAIRSDSDGSTNPSHAPSQRLDHVLVPVSAAVTNALVPSPADRWTEMSDHLPLTVDLELDDVDDQMRSQ